MRKQKSIPNGQIARQEKKTLWKKAVFTVEAAMIIPLTLTLIAALIGYCYYVHQSGWCRGAAYESLLENTENGPGRSQNDSAAETRMKERISQIPVSVGAIETAISKGVRSRASWNGTVLPDVFGSYFSFDGTAALTVFEPVKIKRLEYLLNHIGE